MTIINVHSNNIIIVQVYCKLSCIMCEMTDQSS